MTKTDLFREVFDDLIAQLHVTVGEKSIIFVITFRLNNENIV